MKISDLCAAITVILAGTASTALADNQALPAPIQASKTLTYCSSISAPPMEFMSGAQKPEGADIDIGSALAKRLGLRVKWVNVPFAGLIPDLLAGHCDAIISQLYVKPARLAVIDMVPYMNSEETIMELAKKPLFQNPDELSGRKVASVTGTTETILVQQASAALVKAGKKPINSVTFPDNISALQQLQFGQVDAYATPYETGAYYMTTAPGQFEISDKPYYKILTGIGIRKDEPGLTAALARQLAAMQKDGSYEAIFAKWNITADMLSH